VLTVLAGCASTNGDTTDDELRGATIASDAEFGAVGALENLLTVRSIEGQAARSVWNTRAVFDVHVSATEGKEALNPADDRNAQATRFYEYTLLQAEELFAGLAPGDAQPCRSDSGGPLLRDREVVGVVSGSLKLSSSPCGNYGAFAATFGPAAKSVLPAVKK
jgi:Trypsin